jgi:hypothetical protein
MGQKKSRQHKQAKDTARDRAEPISPPKPPSEEQDSPGQKTPADRQFPHKRQEKNRRTREGKSKAAEKQRSAAEDGHGGAPFGFLPKLYHKPPPMSTITLCKNTKTNFRKTLAI